MLSAWVIGKEQLSVARLIGIAIAIGGVAMVAGAPESISNYPALLMVILGALVWAVAQALIRAFGRDDGRDHHGDDRAGLGAAGADRLALFESGQWESVRTATPANWGALLLVLLLGYLLAYSAWYQLLGKYRVDQVTPFILLMPVAGVITGALALDEQLNAGRADRRRHHPGRFVDRGPRGAAPAPVATAEP